ncbi:unnamed protein product [Rhizopus stolonifer]
MALIHLDAEFVSQELLIGTHTSDEEDNFLQFLNIDLPAKGQDTPTEQKTKMYITQTPYHPGEVNRARYQPDQPNIIATKQRDGDILIYDRTKSDPLLTLKGHTMEG